MADTIMITRDDLDATIAVRITRPGGAYVEIEGPVTINRKRYQRLGASFERDEGGEWTAAGGDWRAWQYSGLTPAARKRLLPIVCSALAALHEQRPELAGDSAEALRVEAIKHYTDARNAHAAYVAALDATIAQLEAGEHPPRITGEGYTFPPRFEDWSRDNRQPYSP